DDREDTNGNGILDPGDPDEQDLAYLYDARKNGINGIGGFGTADQRNDPVQLAAKSLFFRYAIFAKQFATTRETGPGTELTHGGIGELGGNDLLVTLGAFDNLPVERSAAFMHELGHTLGLNHGGGDSANFKPNYHSVMNYLMAFPFDWMFEDDNRNGIQEYIDFNLNKIQ